MLLIRISQLLNLLSNNWFFFILSLIFYYVIIEIIHFILIK